MIRWEELGPEWDAAHLEGIAEMMSTDLVRAQSGPRDQYVDHYACTSEEVAGSLTCRAVARHHITTVDEPLQFGGQDSAPNPVEALLAALGASLQVTTRLYAVHRRLPVRRLSTKMSGTMDTRGFFDIDPLIGAGLDQLDVELLVETDMGDDDFARLAAQVRRSCPVLNMLLPGGWLRLAIQRAAASGRSEQ